MLFSSPIFLLFFSIVFVIAWAERNAERRKFWLLAASYAFYAAWDWRFLSLIALSTAVDFIAGRSIQRSEDSRRRRALLIASMVVNLGVLGFFKYFNFFVESASALLAPMGLPEADRALSIVLPVGISFYTFQSMSYTIDIYRRSLEPAKSLLDFALYVSFFPQLVAGPIVRATAFLPQLRQAPRFADVDFRALSTLFLVGFIKKTCIADAVAPSVDLVFADPLSYSVVAVWIASLLYAIQIYCDFSGYTDMAIACAGMLGYKLVPNFRFPYLARNINDFWRRWHISLSTWLRDYIFLPLGGLRPSAFVANRALFLTMVLAGLWHGASWNFVCWGTLHGLAMVGHRLWQRWRGQRAKGGGWRQFLSTLLTFWFVCGSLILFRAHDFAGAWVMVKAYVAFSAAGDAELDLRLLWWFLALAPIHWLASRGMAERMVRNASPWVFAISFGAAAALALAFVPMHSAPFIYFQF